MGSCSSVQKPKRPAAASSTSPNDKEESTVKALGSSFSLKTSEFGSKEEMFFDSRAWLDSDCDDDFFSVNGDFTPSRGATPNNQLTTLPRAKSNNTSAFERFPDSKSEPSPTGRKKLSDLFQETSLPDTSDEKPETNGRQDSSYGTKPDTADSASNIELATPSRDPKNKTKAGGKMAQCCLPSLGQTLSFSERRPKMSPVHCSA